MLVVSLVQGVLLLGHRGSGSNHFGGATGVAVFVHGALGLEGDRRELRR